MKKISIILAMAAVALGFSSCKQEDQPQYHNPTTFTISTPALQNVEFLTSTDMTDNSTFNLFCTQPDYGYSAICNYSALVSINPDAPIEDWINLENTTPTSAAMSIKTFELGAAACRLLGLTSQEEFDNSPYATQPVKCYFRAVCEIPGIEGSLIVSDNYVSYNAVKLQFAEKKPGWIYICGDVQNIQTGVVNGFLAPSVSNLATYDDNFRLYEPDDMVGQKIYVGQFNLNAKGGDPSNVDDCSQFRFFTELLGWVNTASYGSNEADFYVLPITDKVEAGYMGGEIIAQGLGNWGIFAEQNEPFTVVVDITQLKIYVKMGLYEVSFVGRDPEFN